jgi:hypothetical protein
MRVIAVVDVEGSVVSLMTMPTDGIRPSLPGLSPGQSEVEIDVPDITDEMSAKELHSRLRELLTQHRVDVARNRFVSR